MVRFKWILEVFGLIAIQEIYCSSLLTELFLLFSENEHQFKVSSVWNDHHGSLGG